MLLVAKRYFSSSYTKNMLIKNVTIVGAGLTGSGIAQISAQSGNNVILLDASVKMLQKSREKITENLEKIAKNLYKDQQSAKQLFVKETMRKIQLSSEDTIGEDVDLIIEAIKENLDEKRKLFKNFDQIAPKNTLFVSTTSAFTIGEIAAAVNRKDKAMLAKIKVMSSKNAFTTTRFGGLHFFNPVPQTRLVEFIKTPDQSLETQKSLIAWTKSLGKICVTCQDTPGFIVFKLLLPFVAEALRMVERGDASAKDIDTALKTIMGAEMGPLELSDAIGQDVLTSLLEEWHKKYPKENLFIPVESSKNLVLKKKLGVKSGEGFYKYNNLKYWLQTKSKDVLKKEEWKNEYRLWKIKMRKERANGFSP